MSILTDEESGKGLTQVHEMSQEEFPSHREVMVRGRVPFSLYDPASI